MKKSLFEFAQNNPSRIDETKKPEPPKMQKLENKEDLENILNKYQNMPREDLLNQLHKEVLTQKQNGTFDIAKLENTLNSLDAFLSTEQKNNIKELLNQIK